MVRTAKVKTLNGMSMKQLQRRETALNQERRKIARDLEKIGTKTKTARKLRRRRDKVDSELKKNHKAILRKK